MIDNVQQLAIAADELRGSRVVITSSFTRARDIGHDRHVSTRQTFAMLVEYAGVAFSGATLDFGGKSDDQPASFGVGLDNVVAFNISSDGDLEITENFGKSFERVTTVTQLK